jgi:hypothetical protein
LIRLYFDEDSMDEDLVSALRARGADVVTALEKGMIRRRDDEHLQLATEERRVLFSFNRGDFYTPHTRYLTEGKRHAGILLANQQQYSVGEAMRRILHLANTKTESDMENRLEFLSAWGTNL